MSVRRSARLLKYSESKYGSVWNESHINPGCELMCGGKCCYMRDIRPRRKLSYGLETTLPVFTREHSIYVDGYGSVDAYRFSWIYYCPACQDYWKNRCIGDGCFFSHGEHQNVYHPTKAGESNKMNIKRLLKKLPCATVHTLARSIRFTDIDS
jgi:hypothetical protein